MTFQMDLLEFNNCKVAETSPLSTFNPVATIAVAVQ